MYYDHHITAQDIGFLRTQRGLSQEYISKNANLSQSHYAMIETGAKSATVKTLWKISEALGLRISDLFRMIEGRIQP